MYLFYRVYISKHTSTVGIQFHTPSLYKMPGICLDSESQQPLTPYCVLNLDVAKRNADLMLQRAANLRCQFRPHVKTLKTIEGTLIMTGGRRSKIVVSTMAELKFFIDAGFDDIVYAVPIAGANRIETIVKYLREGKDVKVVCDHIDQFRALVEYVERNCVVDVEFQKFKVLLMLAYRDPSEIDSPMHAVGLDASAETSLQFANAIHGSEVASYEGVYIHAGHSYCARDVDTIKTYIRGERDTVVNFVARLKTEYGIDSRSVGMGSTPTCSPALDNSDLDGITEIHAGNYFTYDTMQRTIGSCTTEDIALTVRCMVISVYEDQNSLRIDLGWTGTSTQGAETGYGEILSHPELMIKSLKQATGEVVLKDPTDASVRITAERYPIGTVLTLASYHACATAHQYETLYVEREGKIVESWKRCPPH